MRSFAQLPTWIVRAAVLVVVLGAIGTASAAVLYVDHPLAESGLTAVTDEDFADVADASDAYTKRLSLNESEGGETRTGRLTTGRDGQTEVRRYRPPPAASQDDVVLVEAVTRDGETETAVTYADEAAVPEGEAESASRVDGATLYYDGTVVPDGTVVLVGGDELTDGLQYAKRGPLERDGERFVRYDVVGDETTPGPPVFDDAHDGYVLLEPETGVVRYVAVTGPLRGDDGTFRMVADRTPIDVPEWVEGA